MPAFFAPAVGAFSGLRGGAQDWGRIFREREKSAENFPPCEAGGDEDFFSAKREIGFWGAALR